MKKLVTVMMATAAAVLLASCGGGSSGPITGGTSGGGQGSAPPPPPPTYSLTVLTSSPQMPSDGSKAATITALVRDTNNNVVGSIPVSFVASSGSLTVTKGTTGDDGTAVATLATAGDTTNRDITVTANAGASTASVEVSVIGTKLSLSGPTSMVQGDTEPYTVALTDSAGTGISGQSVTITSKNDNTVNPGTLTTNTSGQGAFTLNATNSGADTITATAAGMTATQSISVSNDSFKFTSPAANTLVDIGTPQTVTVVWTSSGAPMVGQTVTFSATRGTLSATTAVTGVDGSASVTISSNTAGPSVVSATASGVSGQDTINFIATTPNAINIQASPTTVATQGQSTITATVRDVNNNLVQGQTVDFSLTQDSTGGSLSSASAITDLQGQASTVYTASTTTSATNGVVVSGTVQGTSITGTTSLTVAGQTVFLSLGTGNTIAALNSTQYELPYSVQAVDAAGNAVNGVTVTFSVASLGYGKGFFQFTTADNRWEQQSGILQSDVDGYALDGVFGCITEDPNNDGILDDDYNNDHKIFPGQVVTTDVGSAITANGGSAGVNLIYPKDHAKWVAVRLTATATVQGNQSSTSVDFWLPGLAADYATQTADPPGLNSPYGTDATCSSPN